MGKIRELIKPKTQEDRDGSSKSFDRFINGLKKVPGLGDIDKIIGNEKSELKSWFDMQEKNEIEQLKNIMGKEGPTFSEGLQENPGGSSETYDKLINGLKKIPGLGDIDKLIEAGQSATNPWYAMQNKKELESLNGHTGKGELQEPKMFKHNDIGNLIKSAQEKAFVAGSHANVGLEIGKKDISFDFGGGR